MRISGEQCVRTGQPLRRVTRDDLNLLGLLAEVHWRGRWPRFVRRLEQAGVLYEHLQTVGDRAQEVCQRLVVLGTEPKDAWRKALARHVFLPDATCDV